MTTPSPPPPPGCNGSSWMNPDYYFLCDTEAAWGIVLETLAAAGVVATLALLLTLLLLVCKTQDSNRRSALPVQLLFLLGVLGLFGLTFAFIIRYNQHTGPTRFFLFGVLFALCFSCLLAHALNLALLSRGRCPLSWPQLLGLAVGFSLVQTIIAIEYVTLGLTKHRDTFSAMLPNERAVDFVLLLIYVLFLMASAFLVSAASFCGPYAGWKRHGAHIYVTVLFSIALWAAWITLLTRVNRDLNHQPQWDDPVLAVALVANAWAFLLLYAVPEACLLTKQRCPRDYPGEDGPCRPQLMKQSVGLENPAFSREAGARGMDDPGETLYTQYSAHFQLQNQDSAKDFSIPRPKPRTGPYDDYAGRKDGL
ncbi:retinoic acid-induced protein 3 [Tachyglossus aculeatus]|uniref:retinoic acid-induced protein 3 n=1 Tax=Tachyglossus aculeatus TaxID=9261 RepID=UPI0018F3E8C1|nr:retinoic acid-induced protein 3 [Tachyglossus aculeatus]